MVLDVKAWVWHDGGGYFSEFSVGKIGDRYRENTGKLMTEKQQQAIAMIKLGQLRHTCGDGKVRTLCEHEPVHVLAGGEQVMLKVRIAEISRSAARQFGGSGVQIQEQGTSAEKDSGMVHYRVNIGEGKVNEGDAIVKVVPADLRLRIHTAAVR